MKKNTIAKKLDRPGSMWYTIEVMVERSDLSNLGDRGSAEKVSNLLGVQDP